MNLKLTNLDAIRLLEGMTGLGNLAIEDFKTNYSITRNIDKLSSVVKAYYKSINASAGKYAIKDDSGNHTSPNGQYQFKNEVDKNRFLKQKMEIDETEVQLDLFPIKVSELQKIKGLKAIQMAMCTELIEEDVKVL